MREKEKERQRERGMEWDIGRLSIEIKLSTMVYYQLRNKLSLMRFQIYRYTTLMSEIGDIDNTSLFIFLTFFILQILLTLFHFYLVSSPLILYEPILPSCFSLFVPYLST